ncbi:MAG: threonine/serine dehydratase [Candidatus Thermoplasmatota archaeon]
MKDINLKEIKKAYNRISELINYTPIHNSRTLNQIVGSNIFLKCENFQRTGSFKFRGVINKLLQLEDRQKNRGIIAHSSGNHAQAVALASQILKIKSTIIMPKNAPKVKVKATKGYGAKVVRCKNSIEDREKTCKKIQEKHEYTLIHPYDDNEIIKGAGTASMEMIDQIGEIKTFFCPIGGGGLISGNSTFLKELIKDIKIIGVEPKKADDAYRSLRDDRLYPSEYPDTIADGLRTGLSHRTFKIIKENVDEIITVEEKEIIDAMKFLWNRMKIITEPSAAVSLAGLLKKSKKHEVGRKTGVLISGGNVDLKKFFKKYYKKI